jgi:hypothetical protein
MTNGAGGIRTPGTFRYNGFQDRCSKNSSPEKTNTCETTNDQLTPKSQKQGQIDTQNLARDLAEIVAVWPQLPEHIKAAIKALVRAGMDNE